MTVFYTCVIILPEAKDILGNQPGESQSKQGKWYKRKRRVGCLDVETVGLGLRSNFVAASEKEDLNGGIYMYQSILKL